MGSRQIADTVVEFPASAAATFDYLTDPVRRPEWQSSLRRITDLRSVGDRPGDVGTSWVDVTTVPGIAPRLEVIDCVPQQYWVEIGNWHVVDARLRLDVGPHDDGCQVRARATLTVPRLFTPVLIGLNALAPTVLRADLQRAAGLLAAR
ncbi:MULTISPECIES: SRPBCC family protein [unclassified Gordonia (in: high G+C Gram-positive bacteria)]|uniref:SRPBCC family protein n=1 Tax=unclassified Gordonia (in: high G+C Gram-positive bacteria) TaxID=2657482 RepID=UPI001F10F9E0|nr:SRPBCC family protein [Gordonia sp. ABSL49_1]MCH5645073.1 SRPBCC family protein [Gordonia sp. ABSL49_1]